MSEEILFESDNCLITYDSIGKWIYFKPFGLFTPVQAKDVCERVIDGLKLKKVNKVMNDQRFLKGTVWNGIGEWVNNDWFPRAMAAGMAHVALMQPADILSRTTSDKAVKGQKINDVITMFVDFEEAKKWLKDQ